MQPGETMTLTFVEERAVPIAAPNGVDRQTAMMNVLDCRQWGRAVVVAEAALFADLVAELGRLRELVAEAPRHMVRFSDELENFMGTRCSSCRAIIETYDEGEYPVEPHTADCWMTRSLHVLKPTEASVSPE